LAVKNAAYYEARITALYDELEALEASPVAEYQTDNAGQRMGVKYRSAKEVLDLIDRFERKLAMINSRGGKVLAVFKRGF